MSNIIYKRDASGNIRTWSYEVQGNKWRSHAGLLDGQLVTSAWTVCKPKSQQTAEAQAQFEANAEQQKKLARDYRETIKDIDRPRASLIKPMLAEKYEGWVGPGYVQPKLDGIRCIATVDGLWSRQGKPFVSCPHIREALEPLFEVDPTLIFDGELYNHEFRDDFNSIVSIVRKTKPTENDLREAKEKIEYHIYDLPSLPKNFSERCSELFEMDLYSPLVVVDTTMVLSEDELLADYAKRVQQGYEGQMFRPNGPYQQKRSKFLLKHKSFRDEEFEVLAIEEGQGNWSGFAKRATCKLSDGREFGAGIKGTQAFCFQLLKEPTPKTATVRYFALTPDGVPRFPIAVAFHGEEGRL